MCIRDRAISVLYAVAYTLKMSYKTDYKIEGFFEYVVPPLEGFWWHYIFEKSLDVYKRQAGGVPCVGSTFFMPQNKGGFRDG